MRVAFFFSPSCSCASIVSSGWARKKPGVLLVDECINKNAMKVIVHAQEWAVKNFTFGKAGELNFVGQKLGELVLSAAQKKLVASWDDDWSQYYVANKTFKRAAFHDDDGDDGDGRVAIDNYDDAFAEMVLDLTEA